MSYHVLDAKARHYFLAPGRPLALDVSDYSLQSIVSGIASAPAPDGGHGWLSAYAQGRISHFRARLRTPR